MKNKIKRILKKIRQFLYSVTVKIKCKNFESPLKVNGYSSVTKKTKLGKNVNFNGMKITGCGDVEIGDNFHSGVGCVMISEMHNYEGSKIPYDETNIPLPIKIEDNVWLGSYVIVLGGVTIGEGAIIQAGSVVVSSIPKYGIAGGHPARVFKERNRINYEKLKSEKKFH